MQVLDPTLKQAMLRFPHHETNGEATGVKSRSGKVVPDQSVVMIIPRKERSMLDATLP
jgi:hypothetical protein